MKSSFARKPIKIFTPTYQIVGAQGSEDGDKQTNADWDNTKKSNDHNQKQIRRNNKTTARLVNKIKLEWD